MGAGGKVLDFVVWDVHNGSGADRHSDRHINGAAVRTHLPGDCRTAERGDMLGGGLGESTAHNLGDTELLPTRFDGFQATDMRVHPFGYRTERVMVE